MPDSQFYTVFILLILHVIVLVSLVILIGWIIKKSIRAIMARREVSLFSVGLTAAIFKNTTYSIFVRPMVIIVENINSLAGLLVKTSEDQTGDTAKVVFDAKLFGYSIESYFYSFPLAKLMLAMAFFIIVRQIVLRIYDNFTRPQPIPSSPVTYKPKALVYNLVIIGILAFSFFLVLSVFISIPYLKEMKKPPLFTKDRLDTLLSRSLDTTIPYREPGNSPFAFPSADSLVFTDMGTLKAYIRIPPKYRIPFAQAIKSIGEQSKEAEAGRKAGVLELQRIIQSSKKSKVTKQEALVINYEGAVQSNIVDKDRLFEATVNTFRFYINNLNESITRTIQNFADADITNTRELNRVVQEVQYKILNFPSDTATVSDIGIYPYVSTFFTGYNAGEANFALNTEITVEKYRRDGSEWGFFGSIAKYLITTQSSEIILLIGMLGFGLFGASILSFEKNTDLPFFESFITRPIIPNFGFVLARGFSAALLVYLATKGGITILTGGATTDPDGYVLLFTCFIAAVFSEKIWASVKAKYNL